MYEVSRVYVWSCVCKHECKLLCVKLESVEGELSCSGPRPNEIERGMKEKENRQGREKVKEGDRSLCRAEHCSLDHSQKLVYVSVSVHPCLHVHAPNTVYGCFCRCESVPAFLVFRIFFRTSRQSQLHIRTSSIPKFWGQHGETWGGWTASHCDRQL